MHIQGKSYTANIGATIEQTCLKIEKKVNKMSFKAVFFSLGCALAWFVLLPVLVIGGGIVLLVYALFAEIGESFLGNGTQLDSSAAREIARKVFLKQ